MKFQLFDVVTFAGHHSEGHHPYGAISHCQRLKEENFSVSALVHTFVYIMSIVVYIYMSACTFAITVYLWFSYHEDYMHGLENS